MHDQSGSTRLLASADGDVTGTYTYTYDAYGSTASHTGTAATALLWDGQYQDPASGLYYLRARYYDPATGQFLTPDPLAAISTAATDPLADEAASGTDTSSTEEDPAPSISNCTAQNTAGGEAVGDAGDGLTRVGRWMWRVEYDAMTETGMVQEGAGGTTYVANPAGPAAYGQQAATGSRYVEFDVPQDSLGSGWQRGMGADPWAELVLCPAGLDAWRASSSVPAGAQYRMATDEMTHGRDELTEFRGWFDERKAGLAELGLRAEFAESPPDRVKRSASVIVFSSSRVGQLVVWDTGEATLTLGDVSSDEVLEEHREITSQLGLHDATQTLLAWLEAS